MVLSTNSKHDSHIHIVFNMDIAIKNDLKGEMKNGTSYDFEHGKVWLSS